MKQKTIEETYQKKSQLEHILLRPDTYVGSIQLDKSTKWILRPGAIKFTNEEISYVPALYKIFDEILVNAADNYQRDRKMDLLKVTIDEKEGFVSVHNNGKGIPVQMHKEEKVYVPELIFGHLLTGSNYDDDDKKVVGGRNGYGAKLANIFSHKFIVECGDGRLKKKFKMTWRKNMTIHGQPQIESYSGKDYTIITFYPQFKRFNMEKFDEDIVAIMMKRVYDMAGLMGKVSVYLNEKLVPIRSFLEYVDMYFQNSSQSTIVKIRDPATDTDRWQVVISLTDGQFKQVSFVNSICTSKGGTHVNYIVDQVVQRMKDKLQKKDKSLKFKPFQIKAFLWVFVNCLVENPTFDSQTKQNLTLKPQSFGSSCQLSQKMIKEVLNTGVLDVILGQAKNKQLQKLKKMTGGGKKQKVLVEKLEDANNAGTRLSQNCTLILTEGDSAKSLAVAGLQVVGRDNYGVFPLKGKLLNVRQASTKVLMENKQIQDLMKIVGLTIGKQYEDTKQLRYGSIMIMSDQDTDGSHIKGLVINFIHTFWPSLFRRKGFLKQFITPLLKVSKGSQIQSFYTMSDYKAWAQQIQNIKTWKIKYYKGLGTSTDKQAQQYFEKIQKNRIFFKYQGNPDDQAIDLVFSKKNAQKRKDWLSTYDPNKVMEYNQRQIFYKQFIDFEFIHFSNQDNCRSIASIIDGFKPGQRKVMYACFKRNLKDEIKVAQLSGYVAEHSAYHHGQMSLTGTIINMAQNYVGSNNINLLMPNGQFGSRNEGGKDHASARYIFTNLNRLTRLIFPEPDDHTLTYIQDDGQLVEPQYYLPIIPMGLVNGCQGIGSGWSTSIPNFCPRMISKQLIKRLKQEKAQFEDLPPFYKGYGGQITRKQDGNYETKGLVQFDESDPNIIHIKELPISQWTKDFKKYLQKDYLSKNDQVIVGMKEYHTKNRVHFQLELNEQYATKFQQDYDHYIATFKLKSSISMKNMVGFNEQKRLKKYASTTEILEEFYSLRMKFYGKRKEYLVSKLVRDVEILKNKERFILQVVEQTLKLRNVKKAKIVEMLKQKGYTKFSDFPKIKSTKAVSGQKKKKQQGEQEKDEQGGQDNQQDDSKQYNYLLGMPLWNITYEKVEQIQKNQADKNKQLQALLDTDIKQMWLLDLERFLEALDKFEFQEQEERKKGGDKLKKDKGVKAKKNKQKKAANNEKEAKEKVEKIVKKDKQTKPQVKKSSKPQQKAKKQSKVQSSEQEDFAARMKKKYEQKKKMAATSQSVIAKPVDSKKMIHNIFSESDNEKIEIATVYSKTEKEAVPKKSKKKGRKMAFDSQEQDQQELHYSEQMSESQDWD